jgi:hypothetical protein
MIEGPAGGRSVSLHMSTSPSLRSPHPIGFLIAGQIAYRDGEATHQCRDSDSAAVFAAQALLWRLAGPRFRSAADRRSAEIGDHPCRNLLSTTAASLAPFPEYPSRIRYIMEPNNRPSAASPAARAPRAAGKLKPLRPAFLPSCASATNRAWNAPCRQACAVRSP